MKTSLPILAAVAALAFAAPLRAATVPVTVTIDSVRNINVGDAWYRPPDFYARIWIDGAVLRTPTVFDSNGFVSPPGWTFTRNVSRAKRGGFAPVRIELFDWDDPFSDPQVDIDPGSCPPGNPFYFGCAELSVGGQPVDSYGIDVNLNLRDGSWSARNPKGDSSLGPASSANPQRACTTGAGWDVANVCFTITVGAPAPESLRVSKTGDSDRAFCAPGDCSLREAIALAESGDTVELPASATPYLLDAQGDVHLAIRPPPPPPGSERLAGQIYHLLYLQGPKNGGTAVIRQTRSSFRVFDIHQYAKLVMSHATVTGGGADLKTSTANSDHIHGGGIHNHGTIELAHVTITGNRATFSKSASVGGGGGIYNAIGADAKLTNVTIAGNVSESNEDGSIPLGGGIAGPGVFRLRNTVIANNTVAGAAGFSNCGPGGGLDKAMNIVDEGGNLQFPGGDCGRSISFTWPGRSPWTYWRPLPIALTDPLWPLDPLLVIYPPAALGSAVDTGVAGCGPTDQAGRSAPRASGVVACDAGAIEAQ